MNRTRRTFSSVHVVSRIPARIQISGIRYLHSAFLAVLFVVLVLMMAVPSSAQTWIKTSGPGDGNDVRVLAVNAAGHVFAGTWSSGGTVWKTTDNGASWGQLAPIPDSDPLLGMSITPAGHIIVSVFTKGMSVTTDGGITWERRNNGLTNWRVRQNLIDKSGAVWVASENGIYRSTNEGVEWVNTLAGAFYNVFLDSAGAIVTSDGLNVLRSLDNGATWTSIRMNPTVGLNGIHTTGAYFGNVANGTLYRSTDLGATWTALQTPVKWDVGYTTAWAFSRGGDMYFTRDGDATGIMRSTDNGVTWTVISDGLTTTRVIPLLCHPNGYVFAGTNGSGVFRTKEPRLEGWSVLNITTAPREGRGGYPSTLRYRLSETNLGALREVVLPPDSQATFSGLIQADGYSIDVEQSASGPWTDLFLGRKGPIALAEQQVKQVLFGPTTPFATSVTVQIDSSGEVLAAGGGREIGAGTKIRITAVVKNPSAAETTSVRIAALVDRDTTGSRDFSMLSPASNLLPGESKSVSVVVTPMSIGAYYVSVGVRSSTSAYASRLTDGTGWTAPAFRLTVASGATPWEVVNTGLSHTIIIPASAPITISGQSIAAGDYLGVFHDSAGVLVCAGMERWTGQANLALAAFGDDPTTTAKDGFVAGETIRWRVFRTQAGVAARLRAYYEVPSGIVTHTGTFAVNGISRVSSLAGPESEQCLTLRKGWSLISLNILPSRTLLDSMFKSVAPDLVILKNSQQKVYIPSVPVNSIGSWQPVEGYQVKFSTARTLCFIGDQIVPAEVTVPLQAGWSFIPYLRETEMPVASALGGVAADLVILKDQDGRVYAPAAGINAIGAMKPGQAYQIKMSGARELTYPASVDANGTEGAIASKLTAKVAVAPWTFTNTGTSHTVIVPLSALASEYGTLLAPGDLVGFFYDSLGTEACAGYEAWSGSGAIGVAVFGDDPTTPVKDGYLSGETMKIKVWLASTKHSYFTTAAFHTPGSLGGLVTDTAKFVPNGISGLSRLGIVLTDVGEERSPGSFALRQNFPNPFNPSTVIPYVLGTGVHVRLSVISSLGQEMRVLVDQYQEAGEYRLTFDASGLASGMYFYRLRAGEFTHTMRLMLVR